MLDKNRDIAEEGWRQMSELLDLEMPVKSGRKRRALFWLWLSGAAIGLLLIGFARFFYMQTPKSETPAQQPASSIAHNTLPADADHSTQRSKIETPAAIINFKASAGKVLDIPGAVALVAMEIPASIPSPNPSVPSDVNAVETYEVPESMKSVSPLALRQPEGLVMPNPSIELQTEPLKSGKWRLGWEGALGQNSNTGWNAAATGPIAEYNFKKRWKLRGGLQIASEQYPITSNSMQVELLGGNNMGSNNIQPGEEDINIVAQSVGQGFLWTFQTGGLQLPLTVERRMGSRWSVETGLTPVYWWNIRNAYGQVFLDPTVTPINPATFTEAQLDRSVTSSTNTLDVRISAGFRYYVTPKWSVGTHYLTSLVDIQKTPIVEARQQFLRFSAIRYL